MKLPCPLCKKENELTPLVNNPRRLEMKCSCHPQGAVLEIDAPQEKEQKKASENK